LGEGATVCVIEELEHALDRGARIYAELIGFGSGNEAGRKRHAREAALSQAIAGALSQAGIDASRIDYINAHGNSMEDYDRLDTESFRLVFGAKAYNIPVSSIKSMIGHAMGAAASFQVAATCLALHNSMIPPTINYEVPDPECDLDYVPNTARFARIRIALINAHAIGGTYSALLLAAPEG